MTAEEIIEKMSVLRKITFDILNNLPLEARERANTLKKDIRIYDATVAALKEVEQYRALGTVDELKEAREKQIPKKPIEHKIFYGADYTCPNCKNYVGSYSVAIERLGRNDKLCDNCGQAIDWSEV